MTESNKATGTKPAPAPVANALGPTEQAPHVAPPREGGALRDLPAQAVDDEEASGVRGGGNEGVSPVVTDN